MLLLLDPPRITEAISAESVKMQAIQIRLLGYPQVILNGSEVTEALSQKALALLVYLCIEGGNYTRLELAGLLWGDMNDNRARANLRSALHNLRQVLPGLVDVSRSCVALSPDLGFSLDSRLLAEHASLITGPAGADALIAFNRLYRGEFLEGFYLDGAPEFEAWVLEQREHLRLTYLYALQQMADQAASAGDWQQAIELTRRVLALEPWLESAQRQLMLLLARSGHCNQALAQFEACRIVLDRELDVAPEADTWRLYEMIKCASYGQLHNLPSFPTPFIGRSAELATLEQWAQDENCRLITIAGMGGLGKTRLAVELARRVVNGCRRLFLHGARYISLPERLSPEQFLPIIAQELGLPPSDSSAVDEQLVRYLHQKEMLLLIDSPDVGLIDTGFVARALREIPRLKIIVVSPARLNLHWEWLFSLAGLSYPDTADLPRDLAALERYDSAVMFLECARRVPQEFSSVESIQAVARVCRLVEGLPLALELAAACLRTYSLAQLCERLASNLNILQAEFVDLPERHRNLLRMFETSWDELTSSEQTALTRLAALPGGFNQATAQSIGGLSAGEIEKLLELSYLRQSVCGLYAVPELLRRFASMQTAAPSHLPQRALVASV